MEMAVVTTAPDGIKTIVTVVGPKKTRAFGSNWQQAEKTALEEVSASLARALVEQMQARLRLPSSP